MNDVSYGMLPPSITGEILELEAITQSEAMRKRPRQSLEVGLEDVLSDEEATMLAKAALSVPEKKIKVYVISGDGENSVHVGGDGEDTANVGEDGTYVGEHSVNFGEHSVGESNANANVDKSNANVNDNANVDESNVNANANVDESNVNVGEDVHNNSDGEDSSGDFYIARKLLNTLNVNKNINLRGCIENIRQSYFIDISVSKTFRVRKIAKEAFDENFTKQYNQLYDYFGEINRINLGSTAILKTDEFELGDDKRIFLRAYLSLRPVIEGFLHACRPMIGLDECFFKGKYGGILLGFVKVLEKYPRIEHRLCVRHIYANMKRKYGGATILRDRMLACSKATYFAAWEREMMKLKELNTDAHKWVVEHDAHTWAKLHFS
ncbi:hypothetical protein Cni_G19324 [Canna indica]|uniref:Uncharacterized protein n=1 Tax=Canna indica TaxID=4628 RepID=A0AAQ3QF63_9LILI|nr:hypothetical protein Cni_G19324 [Canna indica]